MADWPLPETFRFSGQAVRWGRMSAGPALVLLHGTPFSSWEWHRVAPHLAATRMVYYYDMPGYGASEKRAGQDVSLGVQNAVAAALFAHWGLDRPDVVAHDFGGATALRAHLIDGLDYRSLTLIDPVALAPWGSPLVSHVRAHEAAFAGMPAYMHDAILPPTCRPRCTAPPRRTPWRLRGAEASPRGHGERRRRRGDPAGAGARLDWLGAARAPRRCSHGGGRDRDGRGSPQRSMLGADGVVNGDAAVGKRGGAGRARPCRLPGAAGGRRRHASTCVARGTGLAAGAADRLRHAGALLARLRRPRRRRRWRRRSTCAAPSGARERLRGAPRSARDRYGRRARSRCGVGRRAGRPTRMVAAGHARPYRGGGAAAGAAGGSG